MSDQPILKPGPDHPITVAPNHNRVVVTVAGKVIAETRNALVLREASYPPALYVPLSDVDASVLERSETETRCPYKGTASYYSIVVDGVRTDDAVWEYQDPSPSVAQIKGYVSFYPDRVEGIDLEADGEAS